MQVPPWRIHDAGRHGSLNTHEFQELMIENRGVLVKGGLASTKMILNAIERYFLVQVPPWCIHDAGRHAGHDGCPIPEP